MIRLLACICTAVSVPEASSTCNVARLGAVDGQRDTCLAAQAVPGALRVAVWVQDGRSDCGGCQ